MFTCKESKIGKGVGKTGIATESAWEGCHGSHARVINSLLGLDIPSPWYERKLTNLPYVELSQDTFDVCLSLMA